MLIRLYYITDVFILYLCRFLFSTFGNSFHHHMQFRLRMVQYLPRSNEFPSTLFLLILINYFISVVKLYLNHTLTLHSLCCHQSLSLTALCYIHVLEALMWHAHVSTLSSVVWIPCGGIYLIFNRGFNYELITVGNLIMINGESITWDSNY